MNIVTKSTQFAGRTLSLEVGRFAQQATSSVLARYGDTVVLATVVTKAEETKLDYFPLSVEYQERLYAGGRIKGSRWVKREGRPTDAEVLSGRLIDRSIRPLFPKSYNHEVQIIVMVLSVDVDNDADTLGIIAASAAVAISPIPWDGPVGASRIGMENEELVVNPKNGNRSGTDLDLVVTSTKHLIPMIEAGAKEVPEDKILAALKLGFEHNQEVISLIESLVSEVGKEKFALPASQFDPELEKSVKKTALPELEKFVNDHATKEGSNLGDIATAVSANFESSQKSQITGIIEEQVKKIIRDGILEKDHRPDGRKLDELRSIEIEVGVLPRTHGSAMFKRGQTQALTVATLGSPSQEQLLESAEGEDKKRYIHHYNFPPFSTGETGRVGSPGRREIGHGALAERALIPVIPGEDKFPYTIRVVSEILSSNGSTSMASTCGSTLALMDAGVPILAPVAGISTGLVVKDTNKLVSGDFVLDKDYKLLTDIIGMEDHYTDMDFKVAGTQKGITAIQLDVKIPGLTLQICEETLARAKKTRLQILEKMESIIEKPRPQLSQYAPKIYSTKIPVDKIGELIGPGGKVIKKLMADTGTTVDVSDDGSVFVTGTDDAGVKKALLWVDSLAHVVTPGEEFDGTVVRIQPFGAFVNILPGKDGLVHVSRMGAGFIGDPNQVVKEGQVVHVRVNEIDETGRISLTMLSPEEEVAKRESNKGREDRPRTGGGFFRAPSHSDRRRPPRR